MRGCQSSASESRCSVASTTSLGIPSMRQTTLVEPPGRIASGSVRAGQPVGDFVQRAVAAEGDDHVVALLARLAAQLCGVVLRLGRDRLDVEPPLQRVDHQVAQPVGDRRRVRVDDDQHPLLVRLAVEAVAEFAVIEDWCASIWRQGHGGEGSLVVRRSLRRHGEDLRLACSRSVDCVCGCGPGCRRVRSTANRLASRLALELLAWDKARTRGPASAADAVDLESLIARGEEAYGGLLTRAARRGRQGSLDGVEALAWWRVGIVIVGWAAPA